MSNKYLRGSEWRKWDLHVHTPASIVNYYTGSDPWGKFIEDLEKLPTEYKVLGINDYIFLDGYEKALEYKTKGRLKNIDLILPVLEFRIEKFAGHKDFKRINFHIIFSNDLAPNIIQQQFLNALTSKYKLTPGLDGITWCGSITKESIRDLGAKIKSTVPQDKLKDYGSDFEEGFNNLCLDEDEILKVLKENTYLKGKYITAIGKTEWDSLAWNDQSIATKKDVINKVDCVFISSENVERFNLAKNKLTEQKVNNLLLDCSDAHSYSNANVKDRIGKCFSWIKADPTFEGLKQILSEPDERIFVGTMPPKLSYLHDNKTKYMKSIKIEKKTGATLTETWFDDNIIPLNPDLIAIIGNKGRGKSALSDIIGLLGNTKQYANFTFLSEDNFRRPKENKARNFQATIEWESGAVFTKGLDEKVDDLQPELVKYIPQNYLEKICTQLGKIEETDFDRELKKVIFSHLDAPDRLGKSSLDDLIAYKTAEADDKIQILKQELHAINEKIVLLEEESQPTHKQKLENLLNKKNEELKAHEKSRPEAVTKPENDPSKQSLMAELATNIDEFRKKLTENEDKIEKANNRIAEITNLISIINNVEERIENLKRQVQTFTDKSKVDFDKLELALDSVLQFSVNLKPIRDKKQILLKEKKKLDEEMDVKKQDSFANKKELIGKQIAELQAKLDEPNKKYQKYIVDLKGWEKKKEQLEGNNLTIDTLQYYKNQIENLKTIPQQLQEALNTQINKTKEIHSVIRKLGDTYRELYTPVSNFVNSHPLVKERFGLNFEVNIVDSGFEEMFWELVSHGVSGTFCGVEEGHKKLQEILSKQDFENENDIVSFLEEIITALKRDQRQEGEAGVKIVDQLRKDKTLIMLYDMIFSLPYLCPRYLLRMADKELSQLSPGERGALLLVFYLLVDKDDRPLVIDQPEENLDNQTVYELLVPCMKKAKKRKQIVIVTHNPNLAVVCDAEQVIQANLDKKNNYRMNYIAGAIENPLINKAVVDILEGTRPAFDKRDEKYL